MFFFLPISNATPRCNDASSPMHRTLHLLRREILSSVIIAPKPLVMGLTISKNNMEKKVTNNR